MEPLTTAGLAAASGVVQRSFLSVFESLNASTEAWYQWLRLKTVAREKYAEHILRTVGTFPLFGTTKSACVDSAYVRVSLSSDIERLRYRSAAEISAKLERQRQGDDAEDERRSTGRDLLDVLDQSSKAVAILGNPGSGKTTALRHAALSLATGQTLRGRRAIPFFLPIRDLAARNLTIASAIQEHLRWLEFPTPATVADRLMSAGDLTLLIDGVDEVDRIRQNEFLTEAIDLIARYPKVVLCVSGRPYSLDYALPLFDKWETLPLAMTDRLAFVAKWFDAVDRAKGDRLLTECAAEPAVLELGSTPLLLSLICALYYNDLRIPHEPDELYARLLEGLLGAWDSFRNIARDTALRELSVRRRVLLVSWIAAETFKARKVVFKTADIESSGLLQRFASATRTPLLDAHQVLKALYNDFGVLVERAPDVYSFSHLTFHEYLTAQRFVDERLELALLRNRRDGGWDEVLRLVAKLLPNANDFMAEWTQFVDLANAHEVASLLATWRIRPLCDVSTRHAVMQALADRVKDTLRGLDVTYTYELAERRLTAQLYGYEESPTKGEAAYRTLQHRRSDAVHRVAVLANLPVVAAIFEVNGFSFDSLNLASTMPFDRLHNCGRLERVRILGWPSMT